MNKQSIGFSTQAQKHCYVEPHRYAKTLKTQTGYIAFSEEGNIITKLSYIPHTLQYSLMISTKL